METLTFYSRLLNLKVDIDILSKNYLNECLSELREVFHLKNSTELIFFIIAKNSRPKIFNKYTSIEYIKNEVIGGKHIDVVWKNEDPIKFYGKVVQDILSS